MKNLNFLLKNLLLTAMLVAVTVVSAQHVVDNSGGHLCSKAKSMMKLYNLNPAPQVSNKMNQYNVKFYFLDLHVEHNSIAISGNVRINSVVTAPQMNEFVFELIDEMTIDSLKINGVLNSNISRFQDTVTVTLAAPLQSGSNVNTHIYYHGIPPTGGFFSGITNATSGQWGKQVTWSLSEPFAARDWWPCKQDLSDKADSAWIFLTTSNTNKAGSNGLLTATVPLPGNKVRYEWKTRYPIDYYLISFAVSEYQEYNIYAKPAAMQGDSILIQNYIYDTPGCLENYQDGIDQTAEFVELYSDLFKLYPFHEEKYGHCLTELGGGMEHQTMTTIGGFGFDLVAHELGHMWFGDDITCATWSDIWINEGFATYTDYLALEFIAGGNYPATWRNQTFNYVMSEPDGSTYIPPEEISPDNVWRIFDGRLSYYKGASILHMLRFEMQDDELFFQSLQNYSQQFADSVATGMDFKESVEQTSGMDLTDFFNQWYFGEGYPTYSIVWNQANGNFNFTVTQTTSDPSTPLFKMLMAYKLEFSDGSDTVIFVHHTSNVNNFSIPVSKTITDIEVDPDNMVVNKVGTIMTATEDFSNPLYFSFGPNPVKDELKLYFPHGTNGNIRISVSDITGKEVYSLQTDEASPVLNLSALEHGIYLLKAGNGNNEVVKKFVK